MDLQSHPIPQDVTGFQFKLIGSMTVKQFAYLAAPAVMDWILYYAELIPWYVRYPLMAIFGLIGITLAFLPIEGRPADVMMKNFIDALFAPTQYIYQKTGQNLAFVSMQVKKSQPQVVNSQVAKQEQQRSQKLQMLLQSTQTQQIPVLDAREAAFMNTVSQFSPQVTRSPQPTHSGGGFHLPFFGGKQNHPTPPPLQPAQNNKPNPAAPAPIQVMPSVKTISQMQTPPPVAMRQTVQLPPLPGSKPLSTMPSVITPVAKQTPLPPTPIVQPISIPAVQPHVITAQPIALPPVQNVPDMQSQLQKIQDEKNRLEQELAKLKLQASPTQPLAPASVQTVPGTPMPPFVKADAKTQNPSAFKPLGSNPAVKTAPAVPQIAHVTKISKQMAQSMGLPNVPDTPNLITGIIHDPRGNVLANILVEVKDKDGNPVRAFKTNQLGQFASATPLLNGTYTIVFEDPAGINKFDTIEIHARAEIIMPIGVVSHDAREELRKALFN